MMEKEKAQSKTIKNTRLSDAVKTSSSTKKSEMEKDTYNTRRYKPSSNLSSKKPKTITKTSKEIKTRSNLSDKFQPLPLLALRTKAVHTTRIKTSARNSTKSKNKLSLKNDKKTKTEQPIETRTPSPQQLFIMELPKLRTIIDNMTRFVKIDHVKIYPLLEIFVDYVQESLPDRVKHKYVDSEEFQSLPEESKKNIERFEKQKLMDPLISPGLELERINKKDYNNKFLEYQLNSLLPILRKCDGKVNFTDKNQQTMLSIFIKRYVTTQRILTEEDSLKPEYKNSPESKLRSATFHTIEALIRKEASVDIADAQGNTVLHTLAKYDGYEEIMKLLLDNYTNIDHCNKNGDTLLHLMISKKEINDKHLQNIKTLVYKGADLHLKNIHGKAPVHVAFELNHFEILNMFDMRGADFNLKTKDGKTSLHLVCESSMKDDVQKVKAIDLLMNRGSNVNDIDKNGYMPIHYAVISNSRAIIERLISFGANMFYELKEMNVTPLHLAAQLGCSSAINTLIHAGVDVNIVAKAGITPLHLAILYSDPLTVECLIVNGADVNRQDAIFGFTPSHMTAFACRQIIDLLAKNGTDINAKNRMGITPIHLASMVSNVEVVIGLCINGADLNCKDNLFGMTPLHWTTMKGKQLNLTRIINGEEYSEDEVMINEFWMPFFLKACQNCYNPVNTDSKETKQVCDVVNQLTVKPNTVNLQLKCEVMKILLKYGAYADMHDNYGRVAVHNIVKNDNVEGMKHFLEYGLDFNHLDTCYRILLTWNSVKIRSYVLWNAMKLWIARLPVAEVYLTRVCQPQFQCYHVYWQQEAKKMKRYMIDEKLSLYELMCMDVESRAVYAKRVTAIERDLEMNFPGYYSLILASFRQATVRMDLEKLAKSKVLQMNDDCTIKVCYERVFSYLSNVDLRAFVESFEDYPTLKQKALKSETSIDYGKSVEDLNFKI